MLFRGLVIATVLSLVLAGCADTPSAADDAALIEKAAPQAAEILPSYELVKVPGGDQVSHSTSLDLCLGDFPSEESRTARSQRSIGSQDAGTVYYVETIVYKEEKYASQAMDELSVAEKKCPTEFFTPGPGLEQHKMEVVSHIDANWNEHKVRRLALEMRGVARSGTTSSYKVVYQMKGRVLSALYVLDDAKLQDVLRPPLNTVEDLADLLATRLLST